MNGEPDRKRIPLYILIAAPPFLVHLKNPICIRNLRRALSFIKHSLKKKIEFSSPPQNVITQSGQFFPVNDHLVY